MSRKLADLLLRDKIISQPYFDEAEKAAKTGQSYIRFLISKRYISETKLLYYLSQKFGVPSINLDKFDVSKEVIKMVAVDLVRRTQAIPIQFNQGTLVVAVCDPSNLTGLEDIRFTLKVNVEAVLTSTSAFDRAIQRYYGGTARVVSAIDSFKRKNEKEGSGLELVEVHDIEDGGQGAGDAPVISLVNGVLSEAIRNSASDIHVENYEHRSRVRMRIDGSLREIVEIPQEMKRAVIARIKIMSKLDIAEARRPQDGRIKLKSGGREIDFRVNSCPTLFGEKVVLRILDKSNLQLELEKLGFEPDQMEIFRKGIYSANGLVLVTGPTGSGKTTTLYSAISELNETTENLATVEDPVEYNLEGINQTQIHKEIGLNFASVLRALLRQDPDVVLVGEIRDQETAEVAIQAALTGHLVLSTLHTNDAPSTITRLINMGVEPFLVTASLNTIIAQRLLRKNCKKCIQPESISVKKLVEVGFPEAVAKQIRPMKGKGCSECNDKGYRGRLAIYEVLEFRSELKEMVLANATAIELKRKAIQLGMKTLRMSALKRVADGLTSLEEAISATMES